MSFDRCEVYTFYENLFRDELSSRDSRFKLVRSNRNEIFRNVISLRFIRHERLLIGRDLTNNPRKV